MHLLVALLMAIATDGAPNAAEGYRMLQKAVEKRDVAALAAILHPDERAWMRRDAAGDGAEAVFARIPTGPTIVTYETKDVVAYSVPSGAAVVFVREGSRWYYGGHFHEKPEPNGPPVTAAKAYELLRARVREASPNARLYSLYTTNRGSLDADGASLHWVAEFLTGKPGELLTCFFDKSEISGPVLGSVPEGREGIADPDTVSYDSKKLYEEAIRRAAGAVDRITKIEASLHRSALNGKALWMLNVYGADDRIRTTIVFDAHTMKFSHQTN